MFVSSAKIPASPSTTNLRLHTPNRCRIPFPLLETRRTRPTASSTQSSFGSLVLRSRSLYRTVQSSGGATSLSIATPAGLRSRLTPRPTRRRLVSRSCQVKVTGETMHNLIDLRRWALQCMRLDTRLINLVQQAAKRLIPTYAASSGCNPHVNCDSIGFRTRNFIAAAPAPLGTGLEKHYPCCPQKLGTMILVGHETKYPSPPEEIASDSR